MFGRPGLQGGADLLPHLGLIRRTAQQPGLHNVYAPALHLVGALLSPWLGLAAVVKLVSFGGAVAWIAGFRFFQRAAELPAASSALFALLPYGFALSYCTPKMEAWGYALAFVGLGLLLRGRRVAVACVVALCFAVHTAAALLLGVAGGVLALALRDARALAALAAGALLATPLLAAHLAAGCSLPEALLFSRFDYLRGVEQRGSPRLLVLLLASPPALVAAAAGAGALWRRSRPLAALCAVLAVLYLNELWIAPFGTRTTLDLLRGLSVLAFPVAIAAGLALAPRPRATALLLLCALWTLGSVRHVLPRSCFVRPIGLHEIDGLEVARCSFRWQGPHIQRAPPPP